MTRLEPLTPRPFYRCLPWTQTKAKVKAQIKLARLWVDLFFNQEEHDQHIHQIMYDRTGYVGEAYQVNSQGVLVLKQPN